MDMDDINIRGDSNNDINDIQQGDMPEAPKPDDGKGKPKGAADVDAVAIDLEKARKALKDGTMSFGQIANSLRDASDLEFLLQEAMVLIVKSKLDEFERYMKDSIDESRVGMKYAQDQAADIRDSGAMALGAGIAGGIMSIASAGVSMAGAGHAMKSASTGEKFYLGKFQSVNQQWTGVSTATNSVGQISASGLKYVETESQADSELDKAQSSKEFDTASRVRDLAKSENDFIQQLIQMLMQLSDMGHQTRSKVVG